MTRTRWMSEELELLARAFAEAGGYRARSSSPKLVGVTRVYPTFVALGGSNRRTRGAVESTTRALLRARNFVLSGERSWRAWITQPESQRQHQARGCSSSFRGILLQMSEEVFRVLDQVAARGPRGPGRRPGTSSAASVGAVPPGSNVAAEDTESECEEEPDRENPNRVGEAGARVHPAPGHDRKTALLASTMRTAGEVQSFIVDAYKAQLLLQEAGAQRGATEDQIIARRTRLHAQRETNLKELGSVMRFQVTESTSNVRE